MNNYIYQVMSLNNRYMTIPEIVDSVKKNFGITLTYNKVYYYLNKYPYLYDRLLMNYRQYKYGVLK